LRRRRRLVIGCRLRNVSSAEFGRAEAIAVARDRASVSIAAPDFVAQSVRP